mgnify:CR=1 FL=1
MNQRTLELLRRIGERKDIMLAVLLLAIVFMMVLPLPPVALDILIAINMTISVVLLMMARPFLLRRMGLKEVDLTPMKIRADFDWLKAGDREEFVRVRRNAEGGLDIYHTQNSQVLSSCAWADGLVDIPVGGTVRKGDMVSYYPFCQFFA